MTEIYVPTIDIESAKANLAALRVAWKKRYRAGDEQALAHATVDVYGDYPDASPGPFVSEAATRMDALNEAATAAPEVISRAEQDD